MNLLDVIAYFAILASLTLAPGPLSAILMAKTLSGDRVGALTFGLGIALGDTLIIVLICGGIGTWLQASPQIFSLGKGLALVYVLWVAIGILRNKQTSETLYQNRSGKRLAELSSGMITCIASPQTLLLYLILVPGLIEVEKITIGPFAILLATTFAALFASLMFVISVAEKLRTWVGDKRKNSIVDWILATVVAGSGFAIVAL